MDLVRKKRIAAFICGVGVVIGAGAFTLATRSDATTNRSRALNVLGKPLGTVAVGDGTVAVLASRPTADDLPTVRTVRLQQSRGMMSDAADLRLATALGSTRVFVAPAKDAGDVCLIVEDSGEDSTAIDCANRSVLIKGAIYLLKPNESTMTVDVFALVSDGVTMVDSTRVENNVVVIRDFSGQALTLTNGHGVVSTVDLGPQS
jgi:hypothetical protein